MSFQQRVDVLGNSIYCSKANLAGIFECLSLCFNPLTISCTGFPTFMHSFSHPLRRFIYRVLLCFTKRNILTYLLNILLLLQRI